MVNIFCLPSERVRELKKKGKYIKHSNASMDNKNNLNIDFLNIMDMLM